MGIVPLQFLDGQNAESLGLTGKEQYTIDLTEESLAAPRQIVRVKLNTGASFEAQLCFFTEVELAYFKNGGILQYVLREMLAKH